MAKRSSREFTATLEQQLKQFKPVRVNPFPLMMDAARQNQAARQSTNSLPAAVPACPNGGSAAQPTSAAQHTETACTICSHCGTGLSELQVQQCHACKAVYCSSCSVINYDEREDRVFCLDCNSQCMQLTSHDESDMVCADSSAYALQHQTFCSPPGRTMVSTAALNCSLSSMSCQAAGLSAERRSSVMRACNMAAAAAAAAADSGGSCIAAMAGISGLDKEQVSPLFAQGGGLSGFGDCSAGRGCCPALGQWDLNSPPVARLAMGQQVFATPAVLPFTAGY